MCKFRSWERFIRGPREWWGGSAETQRTSTSFVGFMDVVHPALRRFAFEPGTWWTYKQAAKQVLQEANPFDPLFWENVIGLKEKLPSKDGDWIEGWARYCAFYPTRRYFQRAWIVQEVVLAKSFEMMIGSDERTLRASDMEELPRLLENVGWNGSIATLTADFYTRQGLPSPTAAGILWPMVDIVSLQWRHLINIRWHHALDAKPDWVTHWFAALETVKSRGCFLPQDKVIIRNHWHPAQSTPTGNADTIPRQRYCNPSSGVRTCSCDAVIKQSGTSCPLFHGPSGPQKLH